MSTSNHENVAVCNLRNARDTTRYHMLPTRPNAHHVRIRTRHGDRSVDVRNGSTRIYWDRDRHRVTDSTHERQGV